MPEYQNGKIYTIRCRRDDTLIYVGSTTQPLAKRWGGHKVDSLNERCQNRLIYKTINNNWDDWYIELYEEYPCENKEQLCKREGEVIREIGTLNSEIAGRTKKEYREDNKEIITTKHKEYNENNKDDIAIKSKVYYENNKDKINEKITCECGCISTKHGLTKHKKTQRHLSMLDAINTS